MRAAVIARMLTYVVRLVVGSTLALGLMGCESGKEAAGVTSAEAFRTADDHVLVTTKLGCVVIWGQPRASGCDADDTEVCVRADWYDSTDTMFKTSLFEARTCVDVGSVEGATVSFTSPNAIPRDPPKKIRVVAESEDDPLPPVTIDNP